MNGVPVAVIGQGLPLHPIANPSYMVPNWTFGIQDDNMQKMVDEVRARAHRPWWSSATTAWTWTSKWPRA